MGNIVSDTNFNLKNSALKDVIQEWAINDYDAGLSYNKDYIIKELLKKRSCCTRNNNIIIALPIIENDTVNPGYYPVNIKVFGSENDDNDKFITNSKINCLLVNKTPYDDLSDNPISYYQSPFDKKQTSSANSACTAIYTNRNSGLNLCNSIKNERTINYSDDISKQSYGYYADLSQNLVLYNNYNDCNCQNSILKNIPVEISSGVPNKPNVNMDEMLAQSIDYYCTSCLQEGKCYIPSYQVSESLCINLSNISNSVAENNSNIVNNQSCNNNLDLPSSEGQSSIYKFFSDNIVSISITLVVIIILIIGAIIIF